MSLETKRRSLGHGAPIGCLWRSHRRRARAGPSAPTTASPARAEDEATSRWGPRPAMRRPASTPPLSLPLVAFLPRRASRQSENARARPLAELAHVLAVKLRACHHGRSWPFCRAGRMRRGRAGTRGADGGGTLLFDRAASRLATGTASRKTQRRAASRPANLRSHAREWLPFHRKRSFRVRPARLLLFAAVHNFGPKLYMRPLLLSRLPFLCPTVTMLFFLL